MKGCVPKRHRGPLLKEADKYRKYKWPNDARAKLYFPKVVSDKWKKQLEKYKYPKEIVIQISNEFFTDGKVRSIINRYYIDIRRQSS